MEKYYLPIDSRCLSHFFSCACIKPSKYFSDEKKIPDIQNKYDGYLLLTKEFGTQETDCCLELFFYPKEKEELVPVSNSWYLYQSFLPISRVVKIYFSSEEQKKKTISNINISSGFIPEYMLWESKNFSPNNTSDFCLPKDLEELDLTDKIRLYDHYLGALALMRTARCDYMNVSENYVDTLSFFNSEIKRQLEGIKDIKDKYWGLFEGTEKNKELLSYLNKVITEDDVIDISKKEGQEIVKNKVTKVIDLSKLDNSTYIVAFLFSYGVGNEGRRNNIDDAIIHNFSTKEIKADKSESIAMYYGYNRGYAVFNNSYGPSQKVDVKFRLEDKLDLYTIESVFNYIINGNKLGRIEYIDDLIPPKLLGKNKKNNFVILDTLIIGKKKAEVLSPEYLDGLYKNIKCDNFERVKTTCFEAVESMIDSLIKNVAEIIHEDTIAEEEDKYSSQIEDLRQQLEEQRNINKSSMQKPMVLARNTNTLKKSQDYNEVPSNLEKEDKNTPKEIQSAIIEEVIDTYEKECDKYKKRTPSKITEELKSRGISIKKGAKEMLLKELAIYETKSHLKNKGYELL